MQEELISVVIPSYNRAHLVLKCIETVFSQTYTNWECIVVDDLSTDNTREVVEQMAGKMANVRYYSNERSKGAQGARNTGIVRANGKWIAFLDSDDEWMPDKLENQLKILASLNYDPYVVVHGDCIVRNHETETDAPWALPYVAGDKPYETLLKQPSPLFQSMLTSRQALMEVGLLDEQVPSYQEWDTALKLATICHFAHMRQPLFIYHLHKGETISKNSKRDIQGYHYITMKYRNDIIKYLGNQFFINAVISNIRRIVKFNAWELGVELLREARKFVPLKSYLFYTTCFRLKIDPDKVRRPQSIPK